MIGPTKIILFGSYAKGTNNENGDIDIEVVADEVNGSCLKNVTRLYKIISKIDLY